MSVNLEQVKQMNQRATFLNGERQRILGMKESAKKSYDNAIAMYKERYGVELTDENLQAEYNTVSAMVQQEVEQLGSLIQSIESGEYKNRAVEQTPVATPQPTQPVQTPPQQTFTQPQADNFAGQQAQVSPFGQPTQQPIATPQANVQNVQGTLPSQPANIGQFSAPAFTIPSSQLTQASEDVSEQAFTPQGWGDPNADFSKILGDD